MIAAAMTSCYRWHVPFNPTHARYNVLDGLQLRDGDGPWLSADTKNVFLDAGFVYLNGYDKLVTVPATKDAGSITFPGTTNPIALELARRRNRQEFEPAADGSWVEIPLP